jgi:hypothetical protein
MLALMGLEQPDSMTGRNLMRQEARQATEHERASA